MSPSGKFFYLTKPGDGSAAATAAAAESRRPKKFLIWLSWVQILFTGGLFVSITFLPKSVCLFSYDASKLLI